MCAAGSYRPESANEDKVSAEMKNGVLSVGLGSYICVCFVSILRLDEGNVCAG